MSYLEDSRARTSQQPEKAQGLTENDQECGHTWQGSSEKWAQLSLLSKTPQCSEQEGLALSSMTLTRWGSMQSGVVSPLQPLVQTTKETEFGLWPTPVHSEARQGLQIRREGKKGAQQSLTTAVMIWPTPTMQALNGGSNSRSVADNRGTDSEILSGGKLNPTWVEWLMNWPTGWTSLEALNEREFQYWQAASATHDRGSFVREMWFNREAGAPPQGSQPDEQCTGECGGALFAMPPRRTQAAGDGVVLNLRGDVPAEAGAQVCAVREFELQQGTRQAISRVAMGVSARVDRLKAIGNGQVPLCAATAWRLLNDL